MTLALILTLGQAAFAQTGEGSLRGVVEDQLGSVIVGATVIATDAAGVTKTTVSDTAGGYLFPRLAPGTYVVVATSPNFNPTESPDVQIAAGRQSQLTSSSSRRLRSRT